MREVYRVSVIMDLVAFQAIRLNQSLLARLIRRMPSLHWIGLDSWDDWDNLSAGIQTQITRDMNTRAGFLLPTHMPDIPSTMTASTALYEYLLKGLNKFASSLGVLILNCWKHNIYKYARTVPWAVH